MIIPIGADASGAEDAVEKLRKQIASLNAYLQQANSQISSGASTSVSGINSANASLAASNNTLATQGSRIAAVSAQYGQMNSQAAKVGATSVASFAATNSSLLKLGTTLRSVKAAVTGLFVVTGVAQAISEYVEFSKAVNESQAHSSVKAAEAEAFAANALELARKTRFTAQDVATAQADLAKIGLQYKQILDTIEPSANLAAAGNITLSKSAEIVGVAIKQWGYEAKDATHITDVMSATASNSAAQISDLAVSYRKSAPAARGAKVSFEEVNGVLAIMANRGIKAEEAGTALKTAIGKLLKPSGEAAKSLRRLLGRDFVREIQNADGSLRPLVEIFEKLERAGFTAQDSFAIFQQRSEKFASILAGTSNQLRQYTQFLREADGAAAKTAAVTEQGLFGSFLKLKSAFQGVKLSIVQLLEPALIQLFDTMTAGINYVSEFADNLRISGAFRDFRGIVFQVYDTLRIGVNQVFPAVIDMFKTMAKVGFEFYKSYVGTVSGFAGEIMKDIGAFASMQGFPTIGAVLDALGEGFKGIGKTIRDFVLPDTTKLIEEFRRMGVGKEMALQVNESMLGVSALAAHYSAVLIGHMDTFRIETLKAIAYVVNAITNDIPKAYADLFTSLRPKFIEYNVWLLMFFSNLSAGIEKMFNGIIRPILGAADRISMAFGDAAMSMSGWIGDEAAQKIAFAFDEVSSASRDVTEAMRSNAAIDEELSRKEEKLRLSLESKIPILDSTQIGTTKYGDALRSLANPSQSAADAVNSLNKVFDDQKKKAGEATAALDAYHKAQIDTAGNTESRPPVREEPPATPPKLNLNAPVGVQQRVNPATIGGAASWMGIGSQNTDAQRMISETTAFRDNLESQRVIFDEYAAAMEERKAVHEQQLQAMQSQSIEQQLAATRAWHANQENLEKARSKVVLYGTGALFGALLSLSSSGQGKLFKLSKQFAIANAVMNAYSAASAAYKNEPGPPWTIPIAAAALVQGFAQVKAIKNTQPTGSASISSGFTPMSAATAPTVSDTVTTAPEVSDTPTAAPIIVNQEIIIEGNIVSETGTLEKIQEFLEDQAVNNRTILIAGGR